jgi:Domain of unknown function (DUF7024)
MRTTPGGWRTLVQDAAVCVVLVLIAVVFNAVLFLHVPVLTEARDFLFYDGWGATLSQVWIPSGNDTRPFSWVLFAWQKRLLGYSPEAINVVQFLLLGLCGAAGYVHLRQLGLKLLSAAGAAALWLASFSSLHAAFWQATQHDKLAFLLSVSTLIVALHALRQAQTRFDHAFAASLTVLVALAVASKSTAFMLSGALVALAVLFTPDRTRLGYRRAATILAAPVVYAIVFALVYLDRMDAAWRAHAIQGNVGTNLLIYLRYVTNTDYDEVIWPAALMFAPIALAWVHACWSTGWPWRSRDKSTPEGEISREAVLVYLCVVFVGCIAILARAATPTAFYLLLPAFLFVGSLAAIGETLVMRGTALRRCVAAVFMTTMVVGLLTASIGNLRAEGRLGRWMRDAWNVAEGYDILRNIVDPAGLTSVVFVLPSDPEGYFYLFSDGMHTSIDPAIPSFIFRQDLKVRVRNLVGEPPATSSPRGELTVTWSDDLRLSEVDFAGSTLYRSAVHSPYHDYVPGEVVSFRKSGDGSRFLGKGWSWPEEWGTWTDGARADVILRLDQPYRLPLEVVLQGQAFVADGSPRQEVEVFANERHLGDWTFDHENETSEFSAVIPSQFTDSRTMKVSLHIAHPRSPESLGRSADSRRLGVLLHEMRITVRESKATDESVAKTPRS